MTLRGVEVSVAEAIEEAPGSVGQLQALAVQQRARHVQLNMHQTVREWAPTAGTYCYQTHIAIGDQPRERFDWLVDVFYNAAALKRQPWYPQFQGGESRPCTESSRPKISRHQLAWGCFDLGLGALRYYRQLVSLARPADNTAVIVARSVDEGPNLPQGARLAFTQAPNGEVLYWQEDCLHWHHICCTPGAGLLPGRLDRWFINGLRLFGLDSAERKTYQAEALQLRDWLQSAQPEADIHTDSNHPSNAHNPGKKN